MKKLRDPFSYQIELTYLQTFGFYLCRFIAKKFKVNAIFDYGQKGKRAYETF